MKSYVVLEKRDYIQRFFYHQQIQSVLSSAPESERILFMCGRRGNGKSTFVDQEFRGHSVLKFSGIRSDVKPGDASVQKYQIRHFLKTLSIYSQEPKVARLNYETWEEAFALLAQCVEKGQWLLFFDDIQWMADYGQECIDAFGKVWQESISKNPSVSVVFVTQSSLYMESVIRLSDNFPGCIHRNLALHALSLPEVQSYLGGEASTYDAFMLAMLVGGYPLYLNKFRECSSVLLRMAEETFIPDAFFLTEQRVVLDNSLTQHRSLEAVMRYLATVPWASLQEVQSALPKYTKKEVRACLDVLVSSRMVEGYRPFNVAANATLVRYALLDRYISFYFRCIDPLYQQIGAGDFLVSPTDAVDMERFESTIQVAFRQYCRQSASVIINALGYSPFPYRTGAYFQKADSNEHAKEFDPEIPLVIDRGSAGLVICEAPYALGELDTSIEEEVLRRREIFLKSYAPAKKATIEYVLLSVGGADYDLKQSGIFDRVLTLSDFFQYDIGMHELDVPEV